MRIGPPYSGDLFLLRLQLLEVAGELLEQFAGLWARFFLKLLEDCLLVGEPREFPRLPDLDAPHVYCLGHDAEKRLGPLINDSIYCLAPTLQPGGVHVAKEVLGEPVAAAWRPARSACNALEVASALVSDRDAVLAAVRKRFHLKMNYTTRVLLFTGHSFLDRVRAIKSRQIEFSLCVTRSI